MRARIPSFVVGGYLLLCIILGGSAQAHWLNLVLALIGIALMGWSAAAPKIVEEGEGARPLYILIIAALLIVLVQVIPLPFDLNGTSFGGFSAKEGVAALQLPPGRRSISLAPYQTVLTIMAAIPALAIFAATERLRPGPRAIALAVVVGMLLSVLAGAIQVSAGSPNWLYLQRIHSSGAVGFFANANHMATLLLVGIPMTAALVVSSMSKRKQATNSWLAIGATLFALIIAGIALNHSNAALALSLPVTLTSIALFPALGRWRRAILLAAVLTFAAGTVVVATVPIGQTAFEQTNDSTSIKSRAGIWKTTAVAIEQNFAVGTGLGTFAQVYPLYEDPAKVTRFIVNHAHNDYLELVLELGIAGFLLILFFGLWWLVTAYRAWTSPLSTPFARAAIIATAAILAHSMVDFPVRTGAISAILAACLSLTVRNKRQTTTLDRGELKASRHVALR
jgi:O-antigen ligase